jgi:transposase
MLQPIDPRRLPLSAPIDFRSLELSKSTWLVTSLSPGVGTRMSKHAVRGGDVAGLLARFTELKRKAQARTGKCFALIVIQEMGYSA